LVILTASKWSESTPLGACDILSVYQFVLSSSRERASRGFLPLDEPMTALGVRRRRTPSYEEE